MNEESAVTITRPATFMASPKIGKLAKALAKAQQEMEVARKSSTVVVTSGGVTRKYADLASVMDACMAALNKNNIAVLQPPKVNGTQVTVTTILLWGSDADEEQWISCDVIMTAASALPQPIGGAITYGRRYGLQALACVAADDDDGELASGKQPVTIDKPARQENGQTNIGGFKVASKPRQDAATPPEGSGLTATATATASAPTPRRVTAATPVSNKERTAKLRESLGVTSDDFGQFWVGWFEPETPPQDRTRYGQPLTILENGLDEDDKVLFRTVPVELGRKLRGFYLRFLDRCRSEDTLQAMALFAAGNTADSLQAFLDYNHLTELDEPDLCAALRLLLHIDTGTLNKMRETFGKGMRVSLSEQAYILSLRLDRPIVGADSALVRAEVEKLFKEPPTGWKNREA